MLRILCGTFLVTHSVDFLGMFVRSDFRYVCTCLVSIDRWTWDMGFLIVCLLPLLDLVIILSSEVLGTRALTTVIQSSDCFYASSPPVSNNIRSPAITLSLPSCTGQSHIYPCSLTICLDWTRFKSNYGSSTDTNRVGITPDTKSVIPRLAVFITKTTFRRSTNSYACVRSCRQDFDTKQFER